MMTIKEFASLCGCTTQTLRYYDKIDLLKPVRVDQWSGYRYYTKAQAIDFVKIKNLQAADFTIDEIKKLLTGSDRQVYEAFDRKIVEQEQKLERIKIIQQSYLTEKNNMERIINGVSGLFAGKLTNFEILRDFGLSPEDGPRVVECVTDFFERTIRKGNFDETGIRLTVDGETTYGADSVAERLEALTPESISGGFTLTDSDSPEEDGGVEEDHAAGEDYDTIWEAHGWERVAEFMDDIPKMSPENEYLIFVRMAEEQYRKQLEYPLFLVGAVMLKQKTTDLVVSCSLERSEDGQNHASLMCKRDKQSHISLMYKR